MRDPLFAGVAAAAFAAGFFSVAGVFAGAAIGTSYVPSVSSSAKMSRFSVGGGTKSLIVAAVEGAVAVGEVLVDLAAVFIARLERRRGEIEVARCRGRWCGCCGGRSRERPAARRGRRVEREPAACRRIE